MPRNGSKTIPGELRSLTGQLFRTANDSDTGGDEYNDSDFNGLWPPRGVGRRAVALISIQIDHTSSHCMVEEIGDELI
jgi:hypothetical protein